MSANEQNQNEAVEQPKKQLTQAEKAKQLLAQRKNGQGNLPGKQHQSTNMQEMRSQNTKKVNNQRKKMGV
ncbi:hypothetical protein [Paenibacillus radicis (ex Gao et al. 2016)]|uniref:Uncharacterized protein n=1 Tax=Paenibacillus radicis (ex Gao et al. 2016) TaxID=1737354 RepID=A0A917M7M1_9BACL|nr:hypothetical protein [Paenibacillus radicis (ex Gao et al. 2016)]GGG82532.1 hypothetical protein GCM10010918_44920 [Paenibacillus radicis (ex Gao et al. 2016)]